MINKIKNIILKLILSKNKYYQRLGVKFGSGCRFYGKIEFGSEPYLVELGDNVSITNSSFITHDGGVWVLRDKYPKVDIIKPINIGDNVFIGMSSILMPGITVGNNVIIGAGSVVTKDIPSNCVVAGIPARIIKSLDEYEKNIVKEGINTKHLSNDEKKVFLLSDKY